MSKDKKKFKDTKVGAFLSKAAPGILGIAGYVLPDAGVFGLVKNLIQKEPDTVLPPDTTVDIPPPDVVGSALKNSCLNLVPMTGSIIHPEPFPPVTPIEIILSISKG